MGRQKVMRHTNRRVPLPGYFVFRGINGLFPEIRDVKLGGRSGKTSARATPTLAHTRGGARVCKCGQSQAASTSAMRQAKHFSREKAPRSPAGCRLLNQPPRVKRFGSPRYGGRPDRGRGEFSSCVPVVVGIRSASLGGGPAARASAAQTATQRSHFPEVQLHYNICSALRWPLSNCIQLTHIDNCTLVSSPSQINTQ